MVSLLSPVASFEAAVKVISAGADEIYCGVMVPGLKYEGLSLRTREFSLSTYEELGKVVRYAHDHNVKTMVTLEFPFMSDIIEEKIRKHISSCVEKEVDALIVPDIGTLLTIKEMSLNVPIHASTYLASMNYEAVDFLKKMGAERVILERQVMINEIKEIVERNKKVEIEVFVHGPGCSNINVNCYLCFVPNYIFQALGEGQVNEAFLPYFDKLDERRVRMAMAPMCRVKYKIYEVGKDSQKEISISPIMDAYTYCSFCELPDLVEAGVMGIKIVGREINDVYQEATTKMYRELLDLIDKGEVESYRRIIKSVIEGQKGSCFPDIQEACEQKRCYYSSMFHAPYKIPYIWKSG